MNKPVAWMYQKIEADQYGMVSLHYSSTRWGENESVHLYTETPLYTHPAKELTNEEIIEELSELEHRQWMMWATNIVSTEEISKARKDRWFTCMVAYSELSEEMKEHDRVWARQALAILRKAQEK